MQIMEPHVGCPTVISLTELCRTSARSCSVRFLSCGVIARPIRHGTYARHTRLMQGTDLPGEPRMQISSTRAHGGSAMPQLGTTRTSPLAERNHALHRR